jgi:predicted SnoaL-like aldol condensation-catalyzing enzyme
MTTPSKPGSEDNLIQTILTAFDTLFNKRDYASAERFWSPRYIQHSAHIPSGREGLFDLVKSLPTTLRYENHIAAATGDNGALAGADHRWGKSPGEVQQAHRIDLEVAVENLRIDLAECAECTADGVVDDDVGIAEIALYRRRYGFDLRRIRHIAAISLRACQLFFQSGETLLVPGEKGDAITAFGESSGERRTRAGSNAGYQANWCGHAIKPPVLKPVAPHGQAAAFDNNFSTYGLRSSLKCS